MAKTKAKINKETTMEDILKREGAGEILEKYNTPCLHCPMAAYEMGTLKVGEMAQAYGIEIEKLLKELNEKTKAK